MKTQTTLIPVLIAAVGLAACGPAPTATSAPPDSLVTETAPQDSTPAPPTASSAPTAGPVIGVQGMTTIVQRTPTEGAGLHPLFEWDPVPDAVLYSLIVHTTDGRPYWAWEGAEASIYLGGAAMLPDDSAGPRLYAPMTWTVLAFDANGSLIGASPARPVAP